jgi:hypothetical protein
MKRTTARDVLALARGVGAVPKQPHAAVQYLVQARATPGTPRTPDEPQTRLLHILNVGPLDLAWWVGLGQVEWGRR